MVYVKYFWGFDSSIEGWTGDNVEWEEGGVSGLPTPHLSGYVSFNSGGYCEGTATVTLKSPRNLNINEGNILCFVFSWDTQTAGLRRRQLNKLIVEVVDESENVVWSITLYNDNLPPNTPSICMVILGSNGAGINVKAEIYSQGYCYATFKHYLKLDSVTIYHQPDQIIYTTIPSTLQSTMTHEIPINKSGAFVVGAMRLSPIQNLSTYNEKLIYDGNKEYDYSDKVTTTVTTTTSVDKVIIKHNSDNTLQVYYECDHAIWLLDSNNLYPSWLVLIKCYHNQNINDPDTVNFNFTLSGGVQSDTKSMSLKFKANNLFNLIITPSSEVIGELTGVNTLTVKVNVKDVNGNVIGSLTYDVLNDTYDKEITIDKSHDGEDLTVDITVTAEGNVSSSVTVKFKLNYEFKY